MAAVVFAFGNRPRLSASEAMELATLVENTDTAAGVRAAAAIRSKVSRDPHERLTEPYVELTAGQLRLMYDVLRAVSPTFDSEAIVQLRLELMRELNLAGGP